MVEGFDRTLLEHFLEECLAECCRQVVDKSRDTEVVVAYDVLLGVEYLSDFNCYLRFLERTCEILHADNGGTDTDVDAGEELGLERIRYGACELFEILHVYSALDLLDENDLALGYVEYKVLVLVREEVLYYVIGRYIVGRDYAYEENNSVYIRVEVQLTGLYADIARKHVIEDYVLDEVVAVILLIIVLLYARKGDSENGSVLACHFVGAFDKYGVVRLYMNAEGLVGIAVADEDIVRIAELDREEVI